MSDVENKPEEERKPLIVRQLKIENFRVSDVSAYGSK
jgi:hypothetical protein